MRSLAALALAALALAGCATAETTPSASNTTLMPDAERWFKLSWEASGEGPHRRLDGRLHNGYGEAAAQVRLLVQSLDAAGAVTSQRIEWLSGTVPGFGVVSFQVRRVPAAEQYRVTVWSYERLQGKNGFF